MPLPGGAADEKHEGIAKAVKVDLRQRRRHRRRRLSCDITDVRKVTHVTRFDICGKFHNDSKGMKKSLTPGSVDFGGVF